MPMEGRSNNALFRRVEQLKRWEDSETNKEHVSASTDKKTKIQFSEGCVFLAACSAGDTEEVERLLSQNTDINTANVDGLTALHQACIDNNLDMVQFLVEHECDVNRGDNEGWTPLHATASCGFLSIAKYLIENGANIAAVNNDGDLPIDIAESNEMEEYLSDVLDEQGIDCEEARSLEERLMLEDVEKMQISHKFQDVIHPRTGASSLHVAAAKGYMSVLRYLVKAGADLNAQDNDGWTSLHAASHWGQKDACLVLADNLANMDIQNSAGQTCFDVCDPELVKLLEELKKKQTSLQEVKPEIQAILQMTSQKHQRRTSVTRMSCQEKSKSVMKDTKAERAQIENLTLSEHEESSAGKPKKEVTAAKNYVGLKPVDALEPSWKKMLRRASETTSENQPEPPTFTQSTPTSPSPANPCLSKDLIPENLKTITKAVPIKNEFETKKQKQNEAEINKESIKGLAEEEEMNKDVSFIPPLRDEESELQRKAHAKRVRETRRSTQGVLLEDIRSAELQFLINTQKEAAKRQAEESDQLKLSEESSQFRDDSNKAETEMSVSEEIIPKGKFTPHLRMRSGEEIEDEEKEIVQDELFEDSTKTKIEKSTSEKTSGYNSTALIYRKTVDKRNQENPEKLSKLTSFDISSNISKPESQSDTRNPYSIDYANPNVDAYKSRSPSPPEDLKNSDGSDKSSLGTQAAIQRRRRPKRRQTGVVYIDKDEEKSDINSKEVIKGKNDSVVSERVRHRYESSSHASSDTSADALSRHSSISCSQSSLNEEEIRNYKELYDEIKKENERLKEALLIAEEELERMKMQMQKLSQNNAIKSSLNDTEKKEKRSLERKLSEMEEEMKNVSKLKTENDKLKAENRALSRVVCKLSK